MKDDSGSYAVFTEQGSSQSQMTAAKVMDVIARFPDGAGRSSRRNVCVHSGNSGRPSETAQNSEVRVSRHLDMYSTTQMAKIMVKH